MFLRVKCKIDIHFKRRENLGYLCNARVLQSSQHSSFVALGSKVDGWGEISLSLHLPYVLPYATMCPLVLSPPSPSSGSAPVPTLQAPWLAPTVHCYCPWQQLINSGHTPLPSKKWLNASSPPWPTKGKLLPQLSCSAVVHIQNPPKQWIVLYHIDSFKGQLQYTHFEHNHTLKVQYICITGQN